MEPVTTRIPEDTHAALVEEADAEDDSVSALIRQYVEKGMKYDDLKAERDRLQRKLTETNARQDDVTEIVEYVEEERERRRQERRTPPVWTRARRFVFGYDPEESDA